MFIWMKSKFQLSPFVLNLYFLFSQIYLFFLVCNDLWNYNPNAHIWTCISDSIETNQPGIYNNRDFPSINNIPSCCYQTISWNITTTNFFFGGRYASFCNETPI